MHKNDANVALGDKHINLDRIKCPKLKNDKTLLLKYNTNSLSLVLN